MKFEDWIKETSKNLDNAVRANSHELDIWEGRSNRNIHKVYMLPYYMQYKMLMSNKRLVYATWALAIGTLILSGLTIYFQFFK